MILIVDNYDSFTYNLVQQVETLGFETQVFAHDQITIEDIQKKKPNKIIISPGPKTPSDAGVSNEVIKHFHKSVPILGVCLGHQCIGINFGAKITHAKKILHGKTSKIFHSNEGIFKGIPNGIKVARYHSLAIEQIKQPIKITARSEDDTIMAIKHRDFPLFGLQFHPESFLTEYGNEIMRNFLNESFS